MRIFSHFSMTYRKYFSLCIYLSVPISSSCSPTTLRFFIESVGNTCDFQEEITTCSGKIISSRYMFPFWKLFLAYGKLSTEVVWDATSNILLEITSITLVEFPVTLLISSNSPIALPMICTTILPHHCG